LTRALYILDCGMSPHYSGYVFVGQMMAYGAAFKLSRWPPIIERYVWLTDLQYDVDDLFFHFFFSLPLFLYPTLQNFKASIQFVYVSDLVHIFFITICLFEKKINFIPLQFFSSIICGLYSSDCYLLYLKYFLKLIFLQFTHFQVFFPISFDLHSFNFFQVCLPWSNLDLRFWITGLKGSPSLTQVFFYNQFFSQFYHLILDLLRMRLRYFLFFLSIGLSRYHM
jgi:hypothetical protein